MSAPVAGLVLAAGAGRRFGGPKALASTASGEPWLARAVAVLRDAGCGRVLAVLGASAEQARRLLPPDAEAVVAERWADGMGASLAAGLAALDDEPAVLVTLVDLPDLAAAAARRVLGPAPGRTSLRRATYGGRPGHPVLIGRNHWAALAATLVGDQGGRGYLDSVGAEAVECGDLGGGTDVDERRGPASSPRSR
jgi:CTP:molybdopterin cytidylyltransferase MocA